MLEVARSLERLLEDDEELLSDCEFDRLGVDEDETDDGGVEDGEDAC